MKCKCRNNSMFKDFEVGKTYSFSYDSITRVTVETSDGKRVQMNKGFFLLSFDPIVEYKRQYSGGSSKVFSTSMVDPTCPIF